MSANKGKGKIMTKKKQLNTYCVAANITLKFATVEIQAESLDDAVLISKSMSSLDFQNTTDVSDEEFEVLGVWKSE